MSFLSKSLTLLLAIVLFANACVTPTQVATEIGSEGPRRTSYEVAVGHDLEYSTPDYQVIEIKIENKMSAPLTLQVGSFKFANDSLATPFLTTSEKRAFAKEKSLKLESLPPVGVGESYSSSSSAAYGGGYGALGGSGEGLIIATLFIIVVVVIALPFYYANQASKETFTKRLDAWDTTAPVTVAGSSKLVVYALLKIDDSISKRPGTFEITEDGGKTRTLSFQALRPIELEENRKGRGKSRY